MKVTLTLLVSVHSHFLSFSFSHFFISILGSECAPGSKVIQEWTLQNIGGTPWPDGTQLRSNGNDCLRPQDNHPLVFPQVDGERQMFAYCNALRRER